ncbi:GIN domain-containing protein [Silvanigrella aquatica]|uniref:Putative auto-transporter adhesin head GIN domain-containing protein n=1 Tax=Silvanigrella aquatica TaxID=1915309 RepID=A0A1L4D3L0_9BACT|nr:DUF2807 domain-containing protein [Silvanigrella aquatica]APJ04793.1 hypothetical protein AXG55_13150 [Silvanigrella aquatica]
MSTFYQNRVVRYFSSIAVANNFDVEIYVGKSQNIELKSKGDFLPRIITEVNTFGKLFIHMDEGFSNQCRASIVINTHVLNSLYIRDSVKASVLNLKGNNFIFEGADSSESVLTGAIDNFKVVAFGAAKLNAVELEAKSISISCNHTSLVHLNARDSLSGAAYGNCNLYYKGNPLVHIFNSGQSSISEF